MDAYTMIMKEILLQASAKGDVSLKDTNLTQDDIENYYEELACDLRYEYEDEFRNSGVETGLESQYSRHYECKEVARQLSDGTWVGWTFWYGGGKYGEPESVEWMGEAYLLDVQEEEKMVVVREFKKREVNNDKG